MATDCGFLSVALCALIFCTCVWANEQSVDTQQKWLMLQRFDFGTNELVEFSYDVTFPESYAPTYLLFYKDSQYQETMINKMDGNPKLCADKFDVLQSTAMNYQILALQNKFNNCTCIGGYCTCKGRVYFGSSQPRTWYAVVSRCIAPNGIPGINFKYWIRKADKPMPPFYPSGQAEVTYSTLTLASLFLLKQCLA